MKIVRSPTDGWYVLQESLDHRGSTVEGERSEDANGHVMLLPEIEFDDDLPVQDPLLLEMDQFLANANDDQDLQDGTVSRPDDYYPDSNLFSLFNESDFNSDNDQSDLVKSPLYSTTNRSIFDGKPLVELMTDFGTSQTVDDDVAPESIRKIDQLVANTSSSSDSDSSSSESDSHSEYSFDSSVESSSSDSSSTLVQKLTTRQKRKRFVETAKQREGRLRKRRERERQRRAAMTPEELAKFREKKRASERASKLKLRLKKAAELQKGLGLEDSGLKDSRLKDSRLKVSKLKNSGQKRPVAQVLAGKLDKHQQVVQQNTNRKKPRAQMSPEELEKLRKAQRDEKRNRLARMTEQERQAHRERIREYDRMWREKNREKKAKYSRKNASSSKLPKNGKLSPQKKTNQKQKSLMSMEELEMKRRAQRDKKRNRLAQMTEQERQKHRARVREYDRLWREKKKSEYQKAQKGATVDLFEARRQRKNAQTRMRRRAKLALETPEQREERLRKRREQARNLKVQATEVGQPEVENHFRQMASMITSKQLTEHRNRKRKHRSGGHDPDYRPKLGDVHKRRQRPSIVDYSDSDD